MKEQKLKQTSNWLIAAVCVLLMVGCGTQSGEQSQGSSYTIVEDEPDMIDSPRTETIEIPSLDSLMITADLKHISIDHDLILFCHQAGWSRGEYKAIADTFYRLGFNCLAIDQRSGNAVNDVPNATAQRAEAAELSQSYADAEQDIIAALNWAKEHYDGQILLLGSSYSAGLVLKIAAATPKRIGKVMAFSPGEYYNEFKLAEQISDLKVPCFLTSSKDEVNGVQDLYKVINAPKKIQFIPSESGKHGAKALWADNPNNAEYWKALRTFLER